MTATQEQYDELARVFQIGSTGDEADWEDLAIDPDYMNGNSLRVATRETLADFQDASRRDWNETSKCEEIRGGLYWSEVQIAKGDTRVALAVIDCGDFRLIYKQ